MHSAAIVGSDRPANECNNGKWTRNEDEFPIENGDILDMAPSQ